LALSPADPCSGLAPGIRHCAAFIHASALEHLMNKDQIKGQIKQVKGNIKETTGKILGDKTMENKGKIQDVTGKIQESYGNLKEDLKKGG
jgi:uncharacterized protein YjbJ (UPF0337 family)